MNRQVNPLIGDPPEEVPLKSAPLVRVLAQLRFAAILSIENRSFVAPFQELIRSEYPVVKAEKTKGVAIGPDGVAETQHGVIWRFTNPHHPWRLSLAPDFLALETTLYESRSDFLNRLNAALVALRDTIAPAVADRLGIRYIDRLSGADLDDIGKLVQPVLAGVLLTDLGASVVHSISESLFSIAETDHRVLARWGRIPENASTDPSVVEAIAEPSWVLDIDMFSTEPRDFSVEELMGQAETFAARQYSMFRWAVTDEFLKRFGG